MTKKTKILFFTPFGGITGSEMLLYYALHALDRTKWELSLYCDKKGPIIKALPADVKIYTSPFHTHVLGSYYRKGLTALGVPVFENYIKEIQAETQADYWYLNTTVMLYMARFAKKWGVKIITHITELESGFEYASYQEMQTAIEYAQLIIGGSNYTTHHFLAAGFTNVVSIPSYVDFSKVSINPEQVKTLRQKMKVADKAFVWMMAGTTCYRKGIDYLPILAEILSDENVHFIWMGSSERENGLFYLTKKKLRNYKNVTFIPTQTADYYNYMQMADGFMLTSREEQFGIVMIDAAYLGKPIVAFNSGGPAEFMEPGMGIVVKNTNPNEFAEAMRAITNGTVTLLPETSRRRAEQFDVNIHIKQLEKVLEDALGVA